MDGNYPHITEININIIALCGEGTEGSVRTEKKVVKYKNYFINSFNISPVLSISTITMIL